MISFENAMRWMVLLTLLVGIYAGEAKLAGAQCRIYLADHSGACPAGTKCGFTLSLESKSDPQTGGCALADNVLVLSVGDGTAYSNVPLSPPLNQPWQIGRVSPVIYTAEVVITPAGPQQLSLKMGTQLIGSSTLAANFQPARAGFFGSYDPDGSYDPNVAPTPGVSPHASYLFTQVSLEATDGANVLSVVPNGSTGIPLQLTLMTGPPSWTTAFTENPAKPTTVTVTFRFDDAVSNPHKFNPYVDTYGQASYGIWQSKIATDAELQKTISDEQSWLENNPSIRSASSSAPPRCPDPTVSKLDSYGGSTIAGWAVTGTDYYQTTFHDNRWFLISPCGNPLFYLGITGVYSGSTPVTGREGTFADLKKNEAAFPEAYDATNGTFSFDKANQIRKFGTNWKLMQNSMIHQRFDSWGFLGAGKFSNAPPDMPVAPVLEHDPAKVSNQSWAVTNVVDGGHPDPWDNTVGAALYQSLYDQMMNDLTNPYIIGWSVGNEKDEIITLSEIQDVLNCPSPKCHSANTVPPAKQALINYAIETLHNNRVDKLASAWGATLVGPSKDWLNEVYNATNLQPPSTEQEHLRQYYEQTYYQLLYQTVKNPEIGIDKNHLYFGSWIVSGDIPATDGSGGPSEDWLLAAQNADVVGFDDFSPGPLNSDLIKIFQLTNKPVLLGAWGMPSGYEGARGFGWDKYPKILTLSDSAAGDAYTQRIQSAAASPNVVGAMWFACRDQPVSGRGGSPETPSTNLVIAEDYAFGMLDVTDRPKYDLVNKVRAANIEALEDLGLLGPDTTPPVTTATVNGPPGLNGWYKGPATVTLTGTDGLAGDAQPFYSLDNGTTWISGNRFSLEIDGVYDIPFYSKDLDGNLTESTKSITVKIDSQPPAIVATVPAMIFNIVPVVLVTVSGNINDNVTGVDPSSAKFVVQDQYRRVHLSGPVSLDPNGNYAFTVSLRTRIRNSDTSREYTVVVSAKDNAGNAGSTVKFVSIKRPPQPPCARRCG